VAREDAAELKRMEKKLTQYGFAGQYQQEPAPRQGGILKIAYWKRYDAQTLPKRFDYIIDDWDFNFKDLESADWVCGQVWGVVGPNRYLLYMKYRPIGFLESLKAVAQFRIMWPGINETIIEDKANGPAIMQALKKHIAGLKEFNPQGSKSERAVAITSQLEGGNVFIPTAELSRAWDIDEAYLIGGYDSPVDAYIGNCAKFPRVDQDGDVDCTSMALLYLNNKTNTLDMLSKLGQW
jgi:predicted phage terminase large subunit-like protein